MAALWYMFSRPSARHVVPLPLWESFDDTVAMDLHEFSNDPHKWYIHIIDSIPVLVKLPQF